MKLNKKQVANKDRLNYLTDHFGFNEVAKTLNLSGSTLGQYLDLDYHRCLPGHKLQLLEANFELCKKTNVKSS